MSNGREWSREELHEVDQMLAEGGYLRSLAVKIDRKPGAILIRAQKVLKTNYDTDLG